jgi:hypothetical protein
LLQFVTIDLLTLDALLRYTLITDYTTTKGATMQKQYLVQRLIGIICIARQQGLPLCNIIAILQGVLSQLEQEQRQEAH